VDEGLRDIRGEEGHVHACILQRLKSVPRVIGLISFLLFFADLLVDINKNLCIEDFSQSDHNLFFSNRVRPHQKQHRIGPLKKKKKKIEDYFPTKEERK
jgi:hypothetical protein